MQPRKAWIAVALLALAGGAGWLALSALHADDAASLDGELGGQSRVAVDKHELSVVLGERGLLVRATDPSRQRADGQLYEVTPAGGIRRAGRLSCKRVHANGRGDGLCLTLADNGIDYDGLVFRRGYERHVRLPIDGVPDRARVSADGRYGAYTSFDTGSSQGYFASTRGFTTFTRIISMESGDELLRLEELTVFKNGKLLNTSDAEFWGVTFARGGVYYATVAVGHHHYMIAGRVGSDRARVVGENIECPSLSPDGRRIAYKQRIGNSRRWRFHVLDLDSGAKIPLAETRSVDDQPEWLDDNTVVYTDDRDVYVVPANGGGKPQRLLVRAGSPAALR